MPRLLKYLFVATLMLPPITGMVAVISGFADPWGMGNNDPVGVFVSAALPILPPGLIQWYTWPMTFGVALLLSPLALMQRRKWYMLILLLYLAALTAGWSFGWAFAPDYLNAMIDGKSYVVDALNRSTWRFGVFLLTDSALLAATVVLWILRK